jgi:hypothetical protein
LIFCAVLIPACLEKPSYDISHHRRRSGTARWTRFCREASLADLLAECAALEAFSAMQRQPLCARPGVLLSLCHLSVPSAAPVGTADEWPPAVRGLSAPAERRFEEAIALFLKAQETDGPSDTLASALAAAYHRLAFQTLADQVRRSVRSVRGNQWNVPRRASLRSAAADSA